MGNSCITLSLNKKHYKVQTFILGLLFVNCKLNYFINLPLYKFYSMVNCLYVKYKDNVFTGIHFNEIEQN